MNKKFLRKKPLWCKQHRGLNICCCCGKIQIDTGIIRHRIEMNGMIHFLCSLCYKEHYYPKTMITYDKPPKIKGRIMATFVRSIQNDTKYEFECPNCAPKQCGEFRVILKKFIGEKEYRCPVCKTLLIATVKQ